MPFMNAEEGKRINKYLSEAGFCSRREADRLVAAGRVNIDGMIPSAGQRVLPGQIVTVDGEVIKPGQEKVILVFNKPLGVECTTAADNPDNIVDYIGFPRRIYPVGRLDKNSTGLILLTNDGSIVNRILKARNYHEKEYVVEIDSPMSPEELSSFASGVDIGDAVTRECVIRQEGRRTYRIILTQGYNRQIRRMFEAFGRKVISLHRIRIMSIKLGDLKPGKYRILEGDELKELMQLLKDD